MLDNYKGILAYDDSKDNKIKDLITGAHFDFRDMCKRLNFIKNKGENLRKSNSIVFDQKTERIKIRKLLENKSNMKIQLPNEIKQIINKHSRCINSIKKANTFNPKKGNKQENKPIKHEPLNLYFKIKNGLSLKLNTDFLQNIKKTFNGIVNLNNDRKMNSINKIHK